MKKKKKKLWLFKIPWDCFLQMCGKWPLPQAPAQSFVAVCPDNIHLFPPEAHQAARRFPRCRQNMLFYFEDRIAAADRDPSVFWWRAAECGQHGPPCTPSIPGTGRTAARGFLLPGYPWQQREKRPLGVQAASILRRHSRARWILPSAMALAGPRCPSTEMGFPCSCLGWSLDFLCGSFSWSWDLWEYMGSLLSKERAGGLCQQGKNLEVRLSKGQKYINCPSISWKLQEGFQAVMRFLEDFLGGGGRNLVH